MGKLTHNHARFVAAYLEHGNASRAYQTAYPNCKPRSADSLGTRLLQRPDVREAIDKAIEKAMKKIEVTPERIIQELACMAFFDLSSVTDDEGNLLPISEIPEEARRALGSMEIESLFDEDGGLRGRLKKVKVSDKKQALELLGKWSKLLMWREQTINENNNKTEVTVRQVDLKDRIKELTGEAQDDDDDDDEDDFLQ